MVHNVQDIRTSRDRRRVGRRDQVRTRDRSTDVVRGSSERGDRRMCNGSHRRRSLRCGGVRVTDDFPRVPGKGP